MIKRTLAIAFLSFFGYIATAQAADFSYLNTWGQYGTLDGNFKHPDGITTDAQGRVYVADTANHRVQIFSSTGALVDTLGVPAPGDANGHFDHPSDVAVDANGFIYVADTDNNRIQKFTSAGTHVATWGGPGPNNSNGTFYEPRGVAIAGDGGILVADSGNHRVQKLSSSGAYSFKWGALGTGTGQFGSQGPEGIAVDSQGGVYVSDPSNSRVQVFTKFGNYHLSWGTCCGGESGLGRPSGLAFDANDRLFVADSVNGLVRQYDTSGQVLGQWGDVGPQAEQFFTVMDVAVAPNGTIYTIDRDAHRAQAFCEAGPAHPQCPAPPADADETPPVDPTSDPTDPGTPPEEVKDSSAPETTIVTHPKKRSKSRKAKFTFTSSEPNSTFMCRVDSKPFAACNSSAKLKAKGRDKHRLKVYAIDAAGNADSTPAMWKWAVKRR